MAGVRRGGNVTRVAETVCGYRILLHERLGGGGFGTVYVGESVERGPSDRVAVKVMIPPPQCSAGYRKYYERELQALRTTHHPNIVQLHHFEADVTCVYILLELCDIDLLEFAQANELTETLKYQFIDNVLCAVLYLHGARIVHRDIKPNNMLINARGNQYVLKLTDLGLSMRLPEDGSSVISATAGVGTHGWMAPEVIRDPRKPTLKLHYGSKSDCFATGLNIHSISSHMPGQWLQPMTGPQGEDYGEYVRCCLTDGQPVQELQLRTPLPDLHPIIAGLLVPQQSQRWNIQTAHETFLRIRGGHPAARGASSALGPDDGRLTGPADIPSSRLGEGARRRPGGGTARTPSRQESAPSVPRRRSERRTRSASRTEQEPAPTEPRRRSERRTRSASRTEQESAPTEPSSLFQQQRLLSEELSHLLTDQRTLTPQATSPMGQPSNPTPPRPTQQRRRSLSPYRTPPVDQAAAPPHRQLVGLHDPVERILKDTEKPAIMPPPRQFVGIHDIAERIRDASTDRQHAGVAEQGATAMAYSKPAERAGLPSKVPADPRIPDSVTPIRDPPMVGVRVESSTTQELLFIADEFPGMCATGSCFALGKPLGKRSKWKVKGTEAEYQVVVMTIASDGKLVPSLPVAVGAPALRWKAVTPAGRVLAQEDTDKPTLELCTDHVTTKRTQLGSLLCCLPGEWSVYSVQLGLLEGYDVLIVAGDGESRKLQRRGLWLGGISVCEAEDKLIVVDARSMSLIILKDDREVYRVALGYTPLSRNAVCFTGSHILVASSKTLHVHTADGGYSRQINMGLRKPATPHSIVAVAYNREQGSVVVLTMRNGHMHCFQLKLGLEAVAADS